MKMAKFDKWASQHELTLLELKPLPRDFFMGTSRLCLIFSPLFITFESHYAFAGSLINNIILGIPSQ